MKAFRNKFFVALLAVAMMFSGIGTTGMTFVKAADLVKTLTLKVSDGDQAVSGLKLILEGDSTDDLELTTNEEGIATYTCVDDQDEPDKYTLKLEDGAAYTLETEVEVVIDFDNSGKTFVYTVNDETYDGSTVEVAVKGEESEPETPAKQTTLKVKVVDEEGNPVSGLKLDNGVYDFTTNADGEVSIAVGQYESGTKTLQPASTSGYTCDAPISYKLVCNWVDPAYIDAVNGEAYDGSVVEMVVKAGTSGGGSENPPAATKVTTFKGKFVDESGNPVSGLAIKLVPTNEFNNTYTMTTSGADGTFEYSVNKVYQDGEYTFSLADSTNYTYEGTDKIEVSYNSSDYKVYVDSFNGAAYDGSVVEIPVKANSGSGSEDPNPPAEVDNSVINVKAVDADGNPVQGVSFTLAGSYSSYNFKNKTAADGTVSESAGTYRYGSFSIKAVDNSGYEVVGTAPVVKLTYDSADSYIESVDGAAYTGLITVTVQTAEIVPEPEITSVSVDPAEVSTGGGDVAVTVKGTVLQETAYYYVYKIVDYGFGESAYKIDYAAKQVTLAGTDTEKTFTATIPAAEDGYLGYKVGVTLTGMYASDDVKSDKITIKEEEDPTPSEIEVDPISVTYADGTAVEDGHLIDVYNSKGQYETYETKDGAISGVKLMPGEQYKVCISWDEEEWDSWDQLFAGSTGTYYRISVKEGTTTAVRYDEAAGALTESTAKLIVIDADAQGTLKVNVADKDGKAVAGVPLKLVAGETSYELPVSGEDGSVEVKLADVSYVPGTYSLELVDGSTFKLSGSAQEVTLSYEYDKTKAATVVTAGGKEYTGSVDVVVSQATITKVTSKKAFVGSETEKNSSITVTGTELPSTLYMRYKYTYTENGEVKTGYTDVEEASASGRNNTSKTVTAKFPAASECHDATAWAVEIALKADGPFVSSDDIAVKKTLTTDYMYVVYADGSFVEDGSQVSLISSNGNVSTLYTVAAGKITSLKMVEGCVYTVSSQGTPFYMAGYDVAYNLKVAAKEGSEKAYKVSGSDITDEVAKVVTLRNYKDADPEVEPHVHELVLVEEKAPTATEPGNAAYYTCECGKTYADAEGTTEIDPASVVIEPTGEEIVDPTPVTVKATSIKKLTKGTKKFKVTWKKVAGVSGYQIKYSTKKSFKSAKTKTVKGNKTFKKTIKKLKKNKKYYVKVRAYKTVDGKKVYSKWSKAKAIKTK